MPERSDRPDDPLTKDDRVISGRLAICAPATRETEPLPGADPNCDTCKGEGACFVVDTWTIVRAYMEWGHQPGIDQAPMLVERPRCPSCFGMDAFKVDMARIVMSQGGDPTDPETFGR